MGFFTKKKKSFDDFPAIGGLLVSKMIADKKMKPGFMYREKSTILEDSGWRIFTGLESEEYTNDPGNCGIYNPSTILEIDPSIADLLLKGIGSVFERTPQNSDWYKVTDFKLDDDYMVKHQLSEKWAIEINNLFEREVEESGDLLFTTGDKSVRLAIWNDDNKSKKGIYEDLKAYIQNRNQENAKTLEQFEFSDDSVLRIGYLIEESDGQKKYNIIFGSNIIDNEVLDVALYYDNSEDKDWAINTWKNIQVNF